MLSLKEAINEKHKQAERMPFNVRMFRGLLSKDEYLLYLHQQLEIFRSIEEKGLPEQHLARVKHVEADIQELNTQGYYSNKILNSTKAYLDHLGALPHEQMLPHVYLNYMAILFGGQMIKKAVPSTGKMYDFENPKEAIASIRRVQKDEWADEVNKGFDFLITIFEDLDAASARS